MWYRAEEISLLEWPNCCPAANDRRIAREFLLFLHNYGFLKRTDGSRNLSERYYIDKEVLNEIITNDGASQTLEAAHIKPKKYNGSDEIANGLAMRPDIHLLFDTGNLRISPDGDVELSSIARENYGWSIPSRIAIPEFTNKQYLRWRWENYNGI